MQFIKKQIIRKARSAALAQALSFSFQQAPAPDRHHHFKTDAPAMAPGNRHSGNERKLSTQPAPAPAPYPSNGISDLKPAPIVLKADDLVRQVTKLIRNTSQKLTSTHTEPILLVKNIFNFNTNFSINPIIDLLSLPI